MNPIFVTYLIAMYLIAPMFLALLNSDGLMFKIFLVVWVMICMVNTALIPYFSKRFEGQKTTGFIQ